MKHKSLNYTFRILIWGWNKLPNHKQEPGSQFRTQCSQQQPQPSQNSQQTYLSIYVSLKLTCAFYGWYSVAFKNVGLKCAGWLKTHRIKTHFNKSQVNSDLPSWEVMTENFLSQWPTNALMTQVSSLIVNMFSLIPWHFIVAMVFVHAGANAAQVKATVLHRSWVVGQL